jgi:acetyl esterase
MLTKNTVLIFLLIMAWSCSHPERSGEAVICGSLDTAATDSVYIQQAESKKGYQVDEDGSFHITLQIENENFMVLDAGQTINLFLEAGDSINIILNKTPVFTGTAANANTNLYRHTQLFDSVLTVLNKKAAYKKPFGHLTATLDPIEKTWFSFPDSNLPKNYTRLEKERIKFFFARLIEQYPFQYMVNLQKSKPVIPENFNNHLPSAQDINNAAYLQLDQFREYLFRKVDMQAKNQIEQSDTLSYHDHVFTNYQLDIIENEIHDKTIRDHLLRYLVFKHLKEFGTGNHEKILERFTSLTASKTLKNNIYKIFLKNFQQTPDHFTMVYKNVDGHALRAYIFSKNKKTATKKPAIVFFFGGGWYQGKPEQFFDFCQYFSDSGFVAISIDYRTKGRHNASPVEGLEDCKSAIRWVKKNAQRFHVDTSLVITSGWSAGGHLATCVALIDSFNTPSDTLSISAKPAACLLLAPGIDNMDNTWFYYTLDEKANPKSLTPIHHVKPNLPPHLILFGTKDIFTKKKDVLPFQRTMQKNDNKCKVIIFEGLTHHDLFTKQTFEEMMAFLQYLF